MFPREEEERRRKGRSKGYSKPRLSKVDADRARGERGEREFTVLIIGTQFSNH